MGVVDEIKADKAAGARRLVAEYGNRLYETAKAEFAKMTGLTVLGLQK